MRPLSKSEEAVLRHLADGLSQKQIAARMERDTSTVSGWALSARNKLGADTVLQAVVKWVQRPVQN